MSNPASKSSSLKRTTTKKSASSFPRDSILSFNSNSLIEVLHDTAPNNLGHTSIGVARRTNYNSDQSIEREDYSISSEVENNRKRISRKKRNLNRRSNSSSHRSKRRRGNNDSVDHSAPDDIKKSSKTSDTNNQIKSSLSSNNPNRASYSGKGCAQTRVTIPAEHIKRVRDFMNDEKTMAGKEQIISKQLNLLQTEERLTDLKQQVSYFVDVELKSLEDDLKNRCQQLLSWRYGDNDIVIDNEMDLSGQERIREKRNRKHEIIKDIEESIYRKNIKKAKLLKKIEKGKNDISFCKEEISQMKADIEMISNEHVSLLKGAEDIDYDLEYYE